MDGTATAMVAGARGATMMIVMMMIAMNPAAGPAIC
jgi:hypothetical protein